MENRIELPKRKSMLGLDFFAREADQVAKDLLGSTLVIERTNRATLYARLREIAAYEGDKEDSMSEGALYQPGSLAISTKYGRRLLDIATNKICIPSCVTIVEAEVYDKQGLREIAKGPGNVTRALDIDKDYNGVPLNFGGIWIGGDGVDHETILKRNKSNLPRNCRGYFHFK